MTTYLIKYISTFENIAVVEAESETEALISFEDADFYQKHLSEKVISCEIANDNFKDKIHEEGYW